MTETSQEVGIVVEIEDLLESWKFILYKIKIAELELNLIFNAKSTHFACLGKIRWAVE